MVFTVLGAVAELERSLIAERVKAGMRNARAKGKSIGRPPLTYLSLEAQTPSQRLTGSAKEVSVTWQPNTAPRWARSSGASRCSKGYLQTPVKGGEKLGQRGGGKIDHSR